MNEGEFSGEDCLTFSLFRGYRTDVEATSRCWQLRRGSRHLELRINWVHVEEAVGCGLGPRLPRKSERVCDDRGTVDFDLVVELGLDLFASHDEWIGVCGVDWIWEFPVRHARCGKCENEQEDAS